MLKCEQRIKNLSVPKGKIDVVLDTDAYCEIDDQYAIAYMLRSCEKLNVKAIYAAPFCDYYKVQTTAEGAEKSFEEINNVLKLADEKKLVLKGAKRYLEDEKKPVISDVSRDLAERVKNYSPENPLYVVAIGAITNIASAILLNPLVAENAVVVWLGGHAHHYHNTKEFNMEQDISAARVVFKSGVPLIQLPCMGVVSEFTLSKPEIECWLMGKNKLCDYLSKITIEEMDACTKSEIWSKVIWDVTAVAWLLNDDDRFMMSRIITSPLPTYDNLYAVNHEGHPMRYVYSIKKNELLRDLVEKLTNAK